MAEATPARALDTTSDLGSSKVSYTPSVFDTTKLPQSLYDITRQSIENIKESDIIDRTFFDQLLEMDEEDEEDTDGQRFSKSIVDNYFTQAQEKFNEMDMALKQRNLSELSSLGHFLKGSSAAIGLIKLKESCEKMQHYGSKKDESGIREISEEEALKRLPALLTQLKSEYLEAEVWLKHFYQNS